MAKPESPRDVEVREITKVVKPTAESPPVEAWRDLAELEPHQPGDRLMLWIAGNHARVWQRRVSKEGK